MRTSRLASLTAKAVNCMSFPVYLAFFSVGTLELLLHDDGTRVFYFIFTALLLLTHTHSLLLCSKLTGHIVDSCAPRGALGPRSAQPENSLSPLDCRPRRGKIAGLFPLLDNAPSIPLWAKGCDLWFTAKHITQPSSSLSICFTVRPWECRTQPQT